MLQVVDLDAAPVYTALSYTWGPAAHLQKISVDGHDMNIRQNLCQFLRTYKDVKDEVLWIDQLCINQECEKEKSHQVSMMGDIYSSAVKTLVWLGQDPHKGLAIAAMRKALSSSNDKDWERWAGMWDIECLEEEKSAIIWMMRRSYWSRHWIAQELILSAQSLVLYGTSQIEWMNLSRLRFGALNEGYFAFESLLKLKGFVGSDDHLELWQMLGNFSAESQCQNARDKVFGIQSLIDKQLRISIDYAKSVRDIYMIAVEVWWRYLQPDIFSRTDGSTFLSGCINLACGMALAAGLDVLGIHFNMAKDQAVMLYRRDHEEEEQYFESNEAQSALDSLDWDDIIDLGYSGLIAWEDFENLLEKHVLSTTSSQL